MGYSAGVFFGVAFPSKSVEGRNLEAYIERYGGTPAPCGVEGVEVSSVGWQPTGETWAVAWIASSWRSYERGDPLADAVPTLLEEGPGWREAIERFLEREGFRGIEGGYPSIGWRFYGSVT